MAETQPNRDRVDDSLVDPDYVAHYENANPTMVNLRDALQSDARGHWLGGIYTECRAVDKSWRCERCPPHLRAVPSRMFEIRRL